MNGVVGFMYPNEICSAVEHPDRFVPLHYGTGGGRIHSGVAGARVPCGSSEANLPPGAAHGAGLSARRAAAAAVAPGPPRALAGDVLHAPRHFGHGHVRLRLSLVPDGGAGLRDLARLSPRHRDSLAAIEGPAARDLQDHDAGLEQHQRTRAAHRRARWAGSSR